MMKDFYPEGYKRKRQREQVYRTISFIVGIAVVVIGGIALGVVVYQGYFAPRRQAPGVTPEMASAKDELETQQKLADPENKDVNSGTVAEENAASVKFDLAGVDYAPSFPAVKITLGDGGVAAPPTAQPDSAAVDNAGEAPAGDSEATTPTAPAPESEAAGDEPAETKPQAPVKPTDEQKPAGSTQDKPKESTKPKPEEKPAEEAKPKPPAEKPPASGSGGYVYRVYAGTASSKESAEQMKNEVSALGVSGTVIRSGGDYLLLVATLEDYDAAMALKNKLSGSGFSGAFATRKSK